MDKDYKTSLFIFRRDLRLDDNTALIEALKHSVTVIPCFIFDPRQYKAHPYLSVPALRFMVESLSDLEEQLNAAGGKLYIFEGEAHKIVEELIRSQSVNAVYVNEDYTPFSRSRDWQIKNICAKAKVGFHSYHDYVLNPPDSVKKQEGGIYTVFTPYLQKAMQQPVAKPTSNKASNYYQLPIKLENRKLFERVKEESAKDIYHGGRSHALSILRKMANFKEYKSKRDIPSLDATTRLSAHHKFGTCSIRETYHTVYENYGPSHALINELYWRDFFTQIGFNFPHVLGEPFHPQFKNLAWDNDLCKFKAWCEGKTGFPIVDAGMRELNQTGFMHNRVRMIAASFLIKDLHIDWRWGEKYFAQKLVDYDPLVNNGNWQWAASTGCDAQPYFRIFNPWLQQEKFDAQALYIKRWVKELKDAEPEDIHQISKKQLRFLGYPQAIVSHEEEKIKALARYQIVRKKML